MISLEQWRAAIGCFSHHSPPGRYIHPYTQRGVYNRHLLHALFYHIRTVFCILYAYTIVQYILLCYVVKVFVILTCKSMFPNNMMLLNTSCIHNMFLHYSIMCCQYINMLFHHSIIYCRYLIVMACFVQLFCSVHMLVQYVTVCSFDMKKLKDNSKLFGCKYDHVSVRAHCQSSMIVHCFLYACISIQILLLSGDVETNPGPVTKVCPACSRSVHIRKTVCDCGNVLISKKCATSVCPNCSTLVNIRMATCSKCGYALNNDKPCPIRESKRLGMQRKRARETVTETVARQEADRFSKATKRACESDTEKASRQEKNKKLMSGKRACESDTERASRQEKNKKLMSDKRACESDTERASRQEKNKKLMSDKRACESDTERASRQEKNKKLMSDKRAHESDIETVTRREANRVAMAGRRASESSDQASQRREKIRIQKAKKLKATVAIDHAIDAFHSKIKQGPEFVCTCCHRMMYKQNVISYNVHKYSRCSAEVLQNVFGEDSSYTCSSGKQWVCKTCDSALTRGNIPVQAKANGFNLPSIHC